MSPPSSAFLRASLALPLAAALTLFCPATAQQQEEEAPRLTVIGAGAGATCADWLDAGRADPELEQWAFGFASAVAAGAQLQHGGDPLARLDADAIRAWLDRHCARRPHGPWASRWRGWSSRPGDERHPCSA